MHRLKYSRIVLAALAMATASLAFAESDDPRHERHELMEDVRDAAKPVGQMLKGDLDFDADVVMASLETWHAASLAFGDLFPEGTETGMNTEAAPAIWEDRAGFDAALLKWREAIEAAKAAAPTTLDEGRPVLGPVFKTCKGCHDTYRIEDEE